MSNTLTFLLRRAWSKLALVHTTDIVSNLLAEFGFAVAVVAGRRLIQIRLPRLLLVQLAIREVVEGHGRDAVFSNGRPDFDAMDICVN